MWIADTFSKMILSAKPGEGHLQTVGAEGDKNVGFDAMIELVVDRSETEVRS